MEDDVEEGTVHVQLAVVVNEAQFAELIHEETDAGARGAHNVGQRVRTDFRNDRLRLQPEKTRGIARSTIISLDLNIAYLSGNVGILPEYGSKMWIERRIITDRGEGGRPFFDLVNRGLWTWYRYAVFHKQGGGKVKSISGLCAGLLVGTLVLNVRGVGFGGLG